MNVTYRSLICGVYRQKEQLVSCSFLLGAFHTNRRRRDCMEIQLIEEDGMERVILLLVAELIGQISEESDDV